MPDPARGGRVLVVNAGSTGMKLSLVDDDERGTPVESPAAAPRSPGGGAPGGPRRRGVRRAGPARRRGAGPAAGPDRPGAAPQRPRPGGDPLHDGRPPGRRPTWRCSTPPSTPTCRPRPRPTRCRGAGGSDWGVRRYGFHGLSVAVGRRARRRHCWGGSRRRAAPRGVPPRRRGVRHGRGRRALGRHHAWASAPLEGLVMATRSRLARSRASPCTSCSARRCPRPRRSSGRSTSESGLSGLSGGAPTCGRSRRAAGGGDARRARSPWPCYDHRLAAAVAAMRRRPSAGLDALVFTGGVGEGSARVRAAAAASPRVPGRRHRPGCATEAGTRRS